MGSQSYPAPLSGSQGAQLLPKLIPEATTPVPRKDGRGEPPAAAPRWVQGNQLHTEQPIGMKSEQFTLPERFPEPLGPETLFCLIPMKNLEK